MVELKSGIKIQKMFGIFFFFFLTLDFIRWWPNPKPLIFFKVKDNKDRVSSL